MAQAQAPETITVTIDGVEHRIVPQRGKSVIQLCDELGIDIPRFCYHPRLTVPANCRMCLVEVEKAPKLLPACHTELRDGMVVNTKNERVKQAQEAVLEFLLVNHPVDCPICDQAGECPLQDQYFKFDRRPSRIGDPVRKVKKGKGIDVGPRVTLDQERCVLCTRCVRFMDEVAREPQLGMFWRNDHAYISNFPGEPLTSNYSLNTVEICPVGALTNTNFRFQKRVWNLKSTPSVCDGCARGCNAWLDQDGQKIFRYRARENEDVNKSWMCDHGRLSYGFVNDARVLAGRIGKGTPFLLRNSPRAAAELAEKLKPVAGKADGFALMVSARASFEDALMAAWFAKELMGADRLYVGGRAPGEKDAILLRDDRNPNRLGVRLAAEAFGLTVEPFEALLEAVEGGRVKMVHAVGTDVPVDAARVVDAFGRLELLSVQAANKGPLVDAADFVLPAATHAEYDGTFVNFMGRIQRFWQVFEPRGEAAAHWDWLGEIARNLGHDVDYGDSDEVYAALAPKVGALSDIGWADLGTDGLQIAGVGAPEDQTGGASLAPEKGVSRWPR